MTREEAIRRIKAWNLDSDDMEVLTVVIPELAESEDERIRKELIEAFEVYDIESSWNLIPVKRVLAWLEKQKERKPELPLMDGDTDTYFDDLRMTTKPLTSREWFNEGVKYAQRLQKEQKPVEWSEGCRGIMGHPDPAGVWKPSEEQMETLERASTNKYLSAKQFDILVSLYEQLKKL